jgi:hypothetical protein
MANLDALRHDVEKLSGLDFFDVLANRFKEILPDEVQMRMKSKPTQIEVTLKMIEMVYDRLITKTFLPTFDTLEIKNKTDFGGLMLNKKRVAEFKKKITCLQDFSENLVIYLRCELAAHVYTALRDFSRIDFASSSDPLQIKPEQRKKQVKKIQAEMSISVLVQHYEKMLRFLTLPKVKKHFPAEWVYWIFAQNYLLSLSLFWRVLLNLRVERVDQQGFNRIRASYDMLRRELREFVKKAYDYVVKEGATQPTRVKLIKDTINEE